MNGWSWTALVLLEQPYERMELDCSGAARATSRESLASMLVV